MVDVLCTFVTKKLNSVMAASTLLVGKTDWCKLRIELWITNLIERSQLGKKYGKIKPTYCSNPRIPMISKHYLFFYYLTFFFFSSKCGPIKSQNKQITCVLSLEKLDIFLYMALLVSFCGRLLQIIIVFIEISAIIAIYFEH